MLFRDRSLLLGVAASLALTAALVATCAGTREPEGRLARAPAPGVESAPDPVAGTHLAAVETATRALLRAEPDVNEADEGPQRELRRRESAWLAEFAALREAQGPEALERAVREVLAARYEPLERKVAGLRGLHAGNAAGTDGLLVAVVEGRPGVTDGRPASLPRAALKLLFERAPTTESARRALARLAFVEEARVAPELRRIASASLAASVRGAQRDEVAGLLRLEAGPRQLAGALAALAADENFGGVVPALAEAPVTGRDE